VGATQGPGSDWIPSGADTFTSRNEGSRHLEPYGDSPDGLVFHRNNKGFAGDPDLVRALNGHFSHGSSSMTRRQGQIGPGQISLAQSC
jgi:hypothetical protein